MFELVDRHPESIFSKAGFYQRMMAFSMRDEHFKVQMFRFVDVLASSSGSKDIVQHLDEYFSRDAERPRAGAANRPFVFRASSRGSTGPIHALERFRHGAAIHRRAQSG